MPEGARHLTRGHGFDFDDLETGMPEDPLLEEIHADLHDQGAEHGLPTHAHRWVVLEIHSGKVVSPPLPTEDLARRHALSAFGPEAGSEYIIRRAWPNEEERA